MTNADPHYGLDLNSVTADIAAVVKKMGELFTDVKGTQPDILFDATDDNPWYLAEEQPDWVRGRDAVVGFLNHPMRAKVTHAMDYHPSDVQVKILAADLALATWQVFTEMKVGSRGSWGEHMRAQGVFRLTADGWRFIYYSESPKSAIVYLEDLYKGLASDAFKARMKNIGMPE
jgi:hypothetical protein